MGTPFHASFARKSALSPSKGRQVLTSACRSVEEWRLKDCVALGTCSARTKSVGCPISRVLCEKLASSS
jgi:hypothetical protein